MRYVKNAGVLLLSLCLWGCGSVRQPHPSGVPYYSNIGSKGWSRPGLTLLDLKAFQQTTLYTCGPAAAITLLRFHGRNGEEMAIAKQMKTNADIGTTPENLSRWLGENGFEVTWGENGTLELLRENLTKGVPTLVEWSDWGGHWVLVVGYDTRNTESKGDDVIIFADPADDHDDFQDGLLWFNAGRFDAMWYDALLFGRLMTRVYITAVPKKDAQPAP